MEIKDLRLLGLNFSKIEAEKNSNYNGKLEIKQNINVETIEKFKPELAKQDTLKIKFSFEVDYGELGKINLKGTMFLSLDPKSLKEILKQWEAKKLSKEFSLVAFNIIFQKASLKALQFEEELGLPPHVQLPRFQLSDGSKQEEQKSEESSK